MTDNAYSTIERRIRKLQQLQSLLQDPELADVVQSVLQASPKSAPVAESQPPLTFKRARKRYQRRGGSLIERTFTSLREWGEPTTAAELADFMKSGGYKFAARDPKIAVSKVLRQLADAQKIKARRGDHSKSAIIYWVDIDEPGLKQTTEFREPLPVQETTH